MNFLPNFQLTRSCKSKKTDSRRGVYFLSFIFRSSTQTPIFRRLSRLQKIGIKRLVNRLFRSWISKNSPNRSFSVLTSQTISRLRCRCSIGCVHLIKGRSCSFSIYLYTEKPRLYLSLIQWRNVVCFFKKFQLLFLLKLLLKLP